MRLELGLTEAHAELTWALLRVWAVVSMIYNHPEVDRDGLHKEHVTVHSKIIRNLLQDGCKLKQHNTAQVLHDPCSEVHGVQLSHNASQNASSFSSVHCMFALQQCKVEGPF